MVKSQFTVYCGKVMWMATLANFISLEKKNIYTIISQKLSGNMNKIFSKIVEIRIKREVV